MDPSVIYIVSNRSPLDTVNNADGAMKFATEHGGAAGTPHQGEEDPQFFPTPENILNNKHDLVFSPIKKKSLRAKQENMEGRHRGPIHEVTLSERRRQRVATK